MAKIRLTKNEYKKQKDSLKRYQRYLPTLELKKTQLLVEIRRIQDSIDRIENEIDILEKNINSWVDLFSEDIDLRTLFEIKEINRSIGNIAGSDIELFDGVVFENKPYDYTQYPLWVDRGVVVVKQIMELKIEQDILHKQQEIIKEELRVTIQRINLFDKVMIPKSKNNIRKIKIYLGDMDTAAVVRGKIAKTKVEKKKMERAA
ncbi:MAG: V-type ATP synthase subunit D [Candidatus Margulisbacteria bacterium GWF2_35_9]|nr:MAG: V-type ATP synthase subunit D [Candidatus Margulisbacteria bacterium GWF2_35_9]